MSAGYEVQRRACGWRQWRVTGDTVVGRRELGRFWTREGAERWIARRTWIPVPKIRHRPTKPPGG